VSDSVVFLIFHFIPATNVQAFKRRLKMIMSYSNV